MNRREQFISERQYLANVSPATIEWYRRCFKHLPTDAPTQQELNNIVIAMRAKGCTPAGCNCVIRCLNAYLRWSGSDLHIKKLKEPSNIPAVFNEQQIKLLVNFKPRSRYKRRLHLICCFMLDTGCRISELLTLRVADIDMDNLLAKLNGKGSRQRLTPISFELRKLLYRWISSEHLVASDLLISTNGKTTLSRRNVLRDIKVLCRQLGFEPPRRTCHAFRHTMACNYVRQGGSVFHLQKQLGHSSLEMSRRYANLVTADLQAVHQQISLLR